jgi:uncharacterized membrane protein YdjX (TVP38/TMEM64 family)
MVMKQLYKVIGLLLVVGALILLLHLVGITHYLSLDYLASRKDMLKWGVRFHYGRAVFYYILLYITVIACAVPAVAPLTMLAGFLFGVLPGSLYALVGSTVGATVSFFGVRYLLRNTIQKRYKVQLQEFNERLGQSGRSSYLLTLQFLSVVPFFVINTLAALAHVDLFTFVWTTVVGSLPIIVLYAFAGQQLSNISSVRDIFSFPVMMVLGLLIVCALFPIVIRRWRSRSQLQR